MVKRQIAKGSQVAIVAHGHGVRVALHVVNKFRVLIMRV